MSNGSPFLGFGPGLARLSRKKKKGQTVKSNHLYSLTELQTAALTR